MNIGRTPPSKSPVDAALPAAKSVSSEAAARRAKLAQNDRAIISSPAREQHQEVSRLVAALKDESVTSDGSKSAVELAAVADRLESGSYDTQDSLRQALETLLAVE